MMEVLNQTITNTVNGILGMFSNIQFYVAIGTILMAVATAWSVERQGRLDRIRDIRNPINSFYIPLFALFSKKWDLDFDQFLEEWKRIDPFIIVAKENSVKAYFDDGIAGKEYFKVALYICSIQFGVWPAQKRPCALRKSEERSFYLPIVLCK